ncbi:MAG: TRAP transporter large permease subunit [Chloroflexi bacterium]|nr:TRAP transporter large permease subunit [Chloroflexota bacterium]
MSPELTGGLLILALFFLLAVGVNIAVALASIGLAGVILLAGPNAGLAIIGMVPYSGVAVFTFSALPLFILMGEFGFHSGISSDLFNSAYKWFGALPGGLAVATIAAAAGFGAVSGSTLVAAVAMTRVTWRDLMRFNYDKGFSSGVLASAGCLAVLIPPSIMGVLYGMFTLTPIGPILIAGVIPGLITATFFVGIILLRAVTNPNLAPRGPKSTLKDKIVSLRRVWGILILVGIIAGGLYGGIFTASEAAAAGAFGAFLIILFLRRLTWSNLRESLLSTAKSTSFIFLIMVGAFIFSRFLVLSKISINAADFIGGLEAPRVIILIGILVLYIGLGMLLDTVSMLAVSISTVFPIITNLGYDPIWFGVIIIMMCEVAAVTPPVGLIAFGIKGILGDEIETWTIFKNAMPFLGAHAVLIALLIMFPQIALWLPSTMVAK